MHILPDASEKSLVALLTYHPTTTTLLAVVGIVVIISVALMAVTVALRKKFAAPRSPEKWDRTELFIMSMFLHAWYLWAVDCYSTTAFNDNDELDVAFVKYVKELLDTGAIDKHWHGEDLMQELFAHAGLNSKYPFGLDTCSKRSNTKRVEFVKRYAKDLRSMFVDLT